jgi:hypothetical protein
MLELVTGVNCIECQHLHMPNPVEDNYICLKTLEKLVHELDELIQCQGFEEIQATWIPKYVKECRSYQ